MVYFCKSAAELRRFGLNRYQCCKTSWRYVLCCPIFYLKAKERDTSDVDRMPFIRRVSPPDWHPASSRGWLPRLRPLSFLPTSISLQEVPVCVVVIARVCVELPHDIWLTCSSFHFIRSLFRPCDCQSSRPVTAAMMSARVMSWEIHRIHGGPYGKTLGFWSTRELFSFYHIYKHIDWPKQT